MDVAGRTALDLIIRFRGHGCDQREGNGALRAAPHNQLNTKQPRWARAPRLSPTHAVPAGVRERPCGVGALRLEWRVLFLVGAAPRLRLGRLPQSVAWKQRQWARALKGASRGARTLDLITPFWGHGCDQGYGNAAFASGALFCDSRWARAPRLKPRGAS